MPRLRSPLLRPEELLRAAQQADETARELKRIVSWLVVEAHDRGVTWDEIGAAFGVSRQAVHERFGSNSRALRRSEVRP
jgi:AraC-like DNA-binding protein